MKVGIKFLFDFLFILQTDVFGPQYWTAACVETLNGDVFRIDILVPNLWHHAGSCPYPTYCNRIILFTVDTCWRGRRPWGSDLLSSLGSPGWPLVQVWKTPSHCWNPLSAVRPYRTLYLGKNHQGKIFKFAIGCLCTLFLLAHQNLQWKKKHHIAFIAHCVLSVN